MDQSTTHLSVECRSFIDAYMAHSRFSRMQPLYVLRLDLSASKSRPCQL